MYILVSGATVTVRELIVQHPNLGVLICPAAGNSAPERGTVWAADNSAFSGFDEATFIQMLKRIEGRDDCRFVTAPDVVGDHEATLNLWEKWNPKIRNYGLTPAFVAQDGCLPDSVPWRDVGAVFIGGTTRYKLGEAAAAIVGEGNRQNVWTHMGRVNTARRILYAAALGTRSIDGSGFSRFSATHLPWALRLAKQPILRLEGL
jgi:hypothetical protein